MIHNLWLINNWSSKTEPRLSELKKNETTNLSTLEPVRWVPLQYNWLWDLWKANDYLLKNKKVSRKLRIIFKRINFVTYSYIGFQILKFVFRVLFYLRRTGPVFRRRASQFGSALFGYPSLELGLTGDEVDEFETIHG